MPQCKTEGCEKQVKEPFVYCFQCNQKRKENPEQPKKEFAPANGFPHSNEQERARLMILSYGKDLLVEKQLTFAELDNFLYAAERYIRTGEFLFRSEERVR